MFGLCLFRCIERAIQREINHLDLESITSVNKGMINYKSPLMFTSQDHELLQTVANDFAPEKIVYVSCDPATLARDCKILGEMGYMVIEYTPADLFPRTSHVETVGVLIK